MKAVIVTSPIIVSFHSGAHIIQVTNLLTSLLTAILFFLLYIKTKLTVSHSFLNQGNFYSMLLKAY